MPRRALLLPLLAFAGVAKAAGTVWVGLALGFTPWVVTLSAGAWACSPALAGWMWQRRKVRAMSASSPLTL